ncbi:MAG: phosphatase PAP2 family protein [Nitrospinae bacterium]|nr:phosphatase PAP2 family protein [Nitrospinota bacterium]
MITTILDIDRSLFLMINNGWASPFNNILFASLTLLGSNYVIIPIVGIMIYLYDRENYRKNFILILSSLLLGGIVIHMLKEMIDRPRPLSDMAGLIKEGKVHINVIFEPLRLASFPSGHSQTIFTVVTILSYLYRRYIIVLFFIASLSAISRVYIGVHYPLDVLAGGAIGVLVSIIMVYIQGYRGNELKSEIH